MQEQNTNNTPSVYPTNKPKKAISTFVGIAIIVLAVAILFGGVFAWQYFTKPISLCWPYCPNMTDQDREQIKNDMLTAGWKIYTNQELGISFKYPADWTYQEWSCNIWGVAFCPLAGHKPSDCGHTCYPDNPSVAINFDPYQGDPVTALPQDIKRSQLELWDNKYKEIYDVMASTFKFTTSTDQTAGKFITPASGENFVIGGSRQINWQMPNGENIYYSLSIDLINDHLEKLGNIIDWNWVKYNPIDYANWDFKTVYNGVSIGKTPDGQTVFGLRPDKNVLIKPGNYKLRLNYDYVGHNDGTGEKGSFESSYFEISSGQPSIVVGLPAESACVWGESCNIDWRATGIKGNVTITLSGFATGDMPYVIANIPASENTFAWIVPSGGYIPANHSGVYRIKICGLDAIGAKVCGESLTLGILKVSQ